MVSGQGIEDFACYDLAKWRTAFLSSGIIQKNSIVKGYSLLVQNFKDARHLLLSNPLLADVILVRSQDNLPKSSNNSNDFHAFLRTEVAETEDMREFVQHYCAFLKTLSTYDLPDTRQLLVRALRLSMMRPIVTDDLLITAIR